MTDHQFKQEPHTKANMRHVPVPDARAIMPQADCAAAVRTSAKNNTLHMHTVICQWMVHLDVTIIATDVTLID
jgi:hypothetical protein